MIPVLLLAVAATAGGVRLRPPEAYARPLDAPVPFYMYEPPAWTSQCDAPMVYHPNIYPDYAFRRQLESHPWRVADASRAALFVVPAYVSASLYGQCGDHASNMRELELMMDNSSSFRRSRGRDHVISAFSWKAHRGQLGAFEKHMRGMIVVHFEKQKYWRRAVVAPYGGIGAGHASIETQPLAERQRALFFMGQADFSGSYSTRRLALHKLPPAYGQSALIRVKVEAKQDRQQEDLPPCRVPGFVSGCTTARSFEDYVSLGGQSNYSLVIHGDTPSTSRIYDGFVFDQVPVIVSDGWRSAAMPFSDALPWDSMAVFVSQREFELSPVSAMRSAVAKASEPSRLQSWRRARGALDWSLEGTCAATAVLLDVARQHLGLAGLPELLELPDCAAPQTKKRDHADGTLNQTLLEEILMEEKFD